MAATESDQAHERQEPREERQLFQPPSPTARRHLPFLRPFPSSLILGAVIVLTVLALALRLYCLDCYGLWYDEVASVEMAQRGVQAILTGRFGWMLVQTPLYYLLVWLTTLPADPATTTVLVRLPSALAGALTVPVAYGLGRETFGRAQGLFAASLVALSAASISYSQDVRPYALLTLLTALSLYCLLVAERTNSVRWWTAFVAVTVANLYFTYFATTLVAPALAPYLLWLLYRAFTSSQKLFRRAAISLVAILALSIPATLDLLQVPRATPDFSQLTLGSVGSQIALLTSRLAQLGIGGISEIYMQWALGLLALLGGLYAICRREGRQVLLYACMVLIPALLLALFKTSNSVFQRYALFAMPFYFLLLGNGLAAIWSPAPAVRANVRAAFRAAAGALAIVIGLLFVYAVLVYFNPEQHRQLSYQPDYRRAALYLARQAKPGDLIVLADEPGLGATVMGFYWRGKPPAAIFDARDPRLFEQHPTGNIYWAVSFFQNDPTFLQRLSDPRLGWQDSIQFERLAVLKEAPPPGGEMLPSVERLVSQFEKELPTFQPVLTLRGGIYQAQGQTEQAARAYRSAGYYFQSGDEYLLTAQGFEARGDQARAWREAIISKFMQPGSPAVHRWLAQALARDGQPAQSAIESRIADALQGR